MDEDVDPTKMCQTLVDKFGPTEHLLATAEPDVLVLFDDWLKELESKAHALIKTHGPLDEKSLPDKLGLPLKGATFLFSNFEKKGIQFSENEQI